MNTPICDYVNQYMRSGALRLHMPGHKGVGTLGEARDITEIPGAGSLYGATGIIGESEQNATELFGCPTFYSAEGSSQCIRAMVHLAMLQAKAEGRKPLIAAGRNAHKTLLSAAALLDGDIVWLYGQEGESYLSCTVTPETLEAAFAQAPITAVYLTSPDYLGNVADIPALAQVAHRHGALLLVDNAHGAYLRFLEPSRHPMDLGADLCCDSAHKTLPVLTGGAYLHVAKRPLFLRAAKEALALFGSTSPSFLILQSLDGCNAWLDTCRPALATCVAELEALKTKLLKHGYRLSGEEPLKLTLCTKPYGYYGTEVEAFLAQQNIVCEFADPDFLVLMVTPQTGTAGLRRLEEALLSLPSRPSIGQDAPAFHRCEKVLSVRDAMLSLRRRVPVETAVGHVLAAPSVGCPPAVPIVVCGERIDQSAVDSFHYYGITHCEVVL